MKTTPLPQNLIDKINFQSLYKERIDQRSDVLVFNKMTKKYDKKTIFRSYNSFLNTPKFDPSVNKSYMFLNKQDNLPSYLEPFLEFAKSIDKRYNQVVINWYNKEDYIESHSDCTAKMLDKNSPILCVNLNESDIKENRRSLVLKSLDLKDNYSVDLDNNSFYVLNNNTTHRHL